MTTPSEPALRGYLARILGWQDVRAVERALRSVCLGASRQAALVLRGDGDLVPIALALHRRALGEAAPFVVSDPRRGTRSASVRSPANFERCLVAFEAARGGSLCVRGWRLPFDFSQVVTALRDPATDVQLIVCSAARDDSDPLLAVPAPIDVPSIRERVGDLGRVIEEYACDAIAALNVSEPLSGLDRAWILERAATSLNEIEKATLRLTAMRASKNMSSAAARLRIAPVSLSRWIDRRKLRRGY